MLALVASVYGIVWSARQIKAHTESVPYAEFAGWHLVRGAVPIGTGLGFTTLGWMFTLLVAPPRLA